MTRFAPGDRVFGNLTMFGYGAFAEFACAPERAWAPMPAGATFEAAATLPESSIIAYQGLKRGRRIKPGASVLVNGASGNVGPFAVQIAKRSVRWSPASAARPSSSSSGRSAPTT